MNNVKVRFFPPNLLKRPCAKHTVALFRLFRTEINT